MNTALLFTRKRGQFGNVGEGNTKIHVVTVQEAAIPRLPESAICSLFPALHPKIRFLALTVVGAGAEEPSLRKCRTPSLVDSAAACRTGRINFPRSGPPPADDRAASASLFCLESGRNVHGFGKNCTAWSCEADECKNVMSATNTAILGPKKTSARDFPKVPTTGLHSIPVIFAPERGELLHMSRGPRRPAFRERMVWENPLNDF
jgi:hypothetical protein